MVKYCKKYNIILVAAAAHRLTLLTVIFYNNENCGNKLTKLSTGKYRDQRVILKFCII